MGMPPTIPFWLGEAPGRSDELSQSVSRLRAKWTRGSTRSGGQEALRWLTPMAGVAGRRRANRGVSRRSVMRALSCLPTQETIVLERFFDEAGGMQLIIHSPYGSRINRAWGLALRKRFCRKFNFELQAAATEDNIVLSLTTAHSFDARGCRALSACGNGADGPDPGAPRFAHVHHPLAMGCGISLALPRFRGGKKVPPQLARMGAEDLIATVFPDQIACAENLVGEREIPDHPLVQSDDRRLPARSDGHRWPRTVCFEGSSRAPSASSRAI